MLEARPRLYVRPALLLALVALLAGLFPAAPAEAQTSRWNAANACPSSLPSSGFDDATGPHGHNIDCLAWFALTAGQSDTTYGTQNPVRRDQVASFTVRVLERLVPSGLNLPPREVDAFRDVTGGPHRANIETLAGFEPPIVAGYQDGTYRPGQPLTRAQFASVTTRMLDRMADQGLISRLPDASSPFRDTRGSAHEGNIARLANVGVVQGRDARTYDPNGTITRGQTASILARVLGGLVDEGVIEQPRRFAGVVHDGTDTAPGELGPRIGGARVTAAGPTEVTATTDSQGRYALWLQQPSTYTVEIVRSGFAPQQRGLVLPNAEAVTDFAMYRRAEAPATSVPTTSTAADVRISDDGAFWVIDPGFDAAAADEIRLRYPAGLVITLGDAGTSDAWFSRHPSTGTSDRIGPDSGTHTLYYRIGTTWHRLEARFDEHGTLDRVNASPYVDPDAS